MKKELRRAMNATRSLVPAASRAARSAAITDRIVALDAFVAARTVAGYVAVRGECDPAAALTAVLDRGDIVALPKVDLSAIRIDWKRRTKDAPLAVGAYGILEPEGDAEPVDPASVDLVLVPGVAFDLAGHRLGQGKGFYDRALENMSNALVVGLCFDFQLVDELPAEPHDRSMQLIVTDTRIVDLR